MHAGICRISALLLSSTMAIRMADTLGSSVCIDMCEYAGAWQASKSYIEHCKMGIAAAAGANSTAQCLDVCAGQPDYGCKTGCSCEVNDRSRPTTTSLPRTSTVDCVGMCGWAGLSGQAAKEECLDGMNRISCAECGSSEHCMAGCRCAQR
mmetsp:Transcript_44579/g.80137  ORF Transcript_44579/g.80137 Transcript_44579/m.80137 type:complete len:151 (+) Transcript_44579:55-507(+)